MELNEYLLFGVPTALLFYLAIKLHILTVQVRESNRFDAELLTMIKIRNTTDGKDYGAYKCSKRIWLKFVPPVGFVLSDDGLDGYSSLVVGETGINAHGTLFIRCKKLHVNTKDHEQYVQHMKDNGWEMFWSSGESELIPPGWDEDDWNEWNNFERETS
nr:hypothetical protein 5 [Gammaproteobacteria bacterium]